MAIDFSQVKTITIPEGSVKKITDSNGAVLWKENLVGWHTVFEGNWSKTIDSNSGVPIIDICNLVDCEAPLKLRITGSINSTIYNPMGTFNWIGESSQSISTIPLNINKEITVTDSGIPTSKSLVILQFECYRYRFEDVKIYFYIQVNNNNKTLRFNIITNKLEEYTLTLNITKVEQYY